MWKPLEYWVALGVGVLIVIERNHKARKGRIPQAIIAAISAGMGVALSERLSDWSGRSEELIVMVVTAFGYPVIDLITAFLADRGLWREVIKERLGGRGRR